MSDRIASGGRLYGKRIEFLEGACRETLRMGGTHLLIDGTFSAEERQSVREWVAERYPQLALTFKAAPQ